MISSSNAVAELQEGTRLTRQGLFQKAISHLLTAQKLHSDAYPTAVNLGICYLGLTRYKEAITVLAPLHSSPRNSAVVDNLLTQAYLSDGQLNMAWATFQEAASLTPKDEKLYAFVADACTDHRDYTFGLRVVETGLQQLPGSARLHYERAVFLARLDRLEEAKPEFDRATQLATDTYIASLSTVQKDLYNQEFGTAIRLLRELIQNGHRDYQTLSLLGTVLMHLGAAPGEPQFAEAKSALEESARDNPNYSATQIALGQIYTLENRFSEARDHLEIARRLEPANPAIYSNLAHVYRKLGNAEKAREMQSELSRLLTEQNLSPEPTPR